MIIGLSGKMGAGKDTVADILQEFYPHVERASFALKVKQIVALLTNTTVEENMTAEGKASLAPGYTDITLGRMQQLVGQGMRDVVCDDIWVRSVLTAARAKGGLTVITDVRYPNEVDMILAQGGVVFRLVRDPGATAADTGRDTGHPSETALDDYPVARFTDVIENNGTMSELRAKVRVCIGVKYAGHHTD